MSSESKELMLSFMRQLICSSCKTVPRRLHFSKKLRFKCSGKAHTLCFECKDNICKICRKRKSGSVVSKVPCPALMKVIEMFPFDCCKNYALGCRELFEEKEDLLHHQMNCKPYQCPVYGCNHFWIAEEFFEHCNQHEKKGKLDIVNFDTPEIKKDINLKLGYHTVLFVFKSTKPVFVFGLNFLNGLVYLFVQSYIKNDFFRYTIRVKGNCESLEYSGSVLYAEENRDVIRAKKAMVIPFDVYERMQTDGIITIDIKGLSENVLFELETANDSGISSGIEEGQIIDENTCLPKANNTSWLPSEREHIIQEREKRQKMEKKVATAKENEARVLRIEFPNLQYPYRSRKVTSININEDLAQTNKTTNQRIEAPLKSKKAPVVWYEAPLKSKKAPLKSNEALLKSNEAPLKTQKAPAVGNEVPSPGLALEVSELNELGLTWNPHGYP